MVVAFGLIAFKRFRCGEANYPKFVKKTTPNQNSFNLSMSILIQTF